MREKRGLRVCEKRALRRIFEPERDEVCKENYILRRLMVYAPQSILFG
jgi:hypothetical protein